MVANSCIVVAVPIHTVQQHIGSRYRPCETLKFPLKVFVWGGIHKGINHEENKMRPAFLVTHNHTQPHTNQPHTTRKPAHTPQTHNPQRQMHSSESTDQNALSDNAAISPEISFWTFVFATANPIEGLGEGGLAWRPRFLCWHMVRAPTQSYASPVLDNAALYIWRMLAFAPGKMDSEKGRRSRSLIQKRACWHPEWIG
jgi:hypothetical protein